MPTTRLWKGPLLAQASMIYVMLGLLLAVWGVLWLLYEIDRDVPHGGVYAVCVGLLISGLSLFWVGLRMGRGSLDAPLSSERSVPVVDEGQGIDRSV